jgi:hypothetical protein
LSIPVAIRFQEYVSVTSIDVFAVLNPAEGKDVLLYLLCDVKVAASATG